MSVNYPSLVAVLTVVLLKNSTVFGEPILFQVYEAGNVNLIRWYDIIKAVSYSFKGISDEEIRRKLENESCNATVHSKLPMDNNNISMCDSYNEALNRSTCTKKTKELLTAECLAIYMYSSEFYSTYNPNIRNRKWEPYAVFTWLLYSAVKKLVALRPLPSDTILYRGLNGIFDINVTGPFYFPTFSSTSLNRNVSERYGNKTTMQFLPKVPKLAARLKGYVKYEFEEEVLLPPFEAFQVINKTGRIIYLKSSDSQDFYVPSRGSNRSFGLVAIVTLIFLMLASL